MTAASGIRSALEAKARELGFDQFGITAAATDKSVIEGFRQFIKLGRHAGMQWLADRMHQREHPQQLWPEAQSVIMLSMNYGPEEDPRPLLGAKDRGNISVYARGKDYHDLIKKRLKVMARWMVAEYGCDLKVFVDTAPVPEKPLAVSAGLGWQGKHTNMVSPTFGSWVFLGAIYTDMKLPADSPHRDQCGSCTQCLTVCPTNAFPNPYEIDAGRCISYLTIEHKGPIPLEFRKALGNRIYGCDDCLAVCPWNKFAQEASEVAFHARAELGAPRLSELAGLDDPAFRKLFSGSPIKRIGRDQFIRNVLMAIGNSDDKSLLPVTEKLQHDAAAVVREAADWAAKELQNIGN